MAWPTPDFLRVCGSGIARAPSALLAPSWWPASSTHKHPIRKVALDYIGKYEKAFGAGSFSTFGGHAWDAGLLLENAVPLALKSAQPGASSSCCLARCH